jgi:uncharacterized protein (DUF305 family)
MSHYLALGAELIVEAIIMYFVMFAMVEAWPHIYNNANNLYMTLMMVAPMGMVMLLAMRHMYLREGLNKFLHLSLLAVFLLSFFALRAQAGIGDVQLIRSMIPHHSGAVLMCKKARLRDPELIALCSQIEESQSREILQMETILERLD